MEAALLFLRAVGIAIDISELAIRGIVEGILPAIENSSQVQKAAAVLLEAMQSASNLEVAKNMINLVQICSAMH